MTRPPRLLHIRESTMTITARRLVTASLAACAAVGGLALTADARTSLGAGQSGTAGSLTPTVRQIDQPYEGQHTFRVYACASKDDTTLRAADFSLTGTNGTTVVAASDTEVNAIPLDPVTTLSSGGCIEGDLAGTVGSDLATISFQNGALTWKPSQAQGRDTVDFGQTARTTEGLSVTVSALEDKGNDNYGFTVKACSTSGTTIGWDDIQVVANDGQVRPVGRSEDTMGPNGLPQSTTLEPNDCVTGKVFIHSPSGIEYVSVRGLTFLAPQQTLPQQSTPPKQNPTPEPSQAPTSKPTATSNGSGQPGLPKTGN